jgi:hypothetical protein
MRHERPAAHVAMRAIQLLPQMLDPRRVLAVEEFKQRLSQSPRDVRFEARDLAPAGDAVIGLDLEVRLRTDSEAAQRLDFQIGSAIDNVRGGVVFLSDGIGQNRKAAGHRSGSEQISTCQGQRELRHDGSWESAVLVQSSEQSETSYRCGRAVSSAAV